LDTLLPFGFCLLESFVILSIPSNKTIWFSLWLFAVMVLGLLAMFHMRQQMFEAKAIDLFREHFDHNADSMYFAVVRYCDKSIIILRQSSFMMVFACAASLPISATKLLRDGHLELIFVSAVYLVCLYRLSKYDLDSYLAEVSTPWRSYSRRQEIVVATEKFEISATSFLPSSQVGNESSAIVFLPGWQAGRSGTLKGLCAYLGEDAGMPSMLICSKGTRADAKSWSRDAVAIADYVIENKYSQLTFVGHSEGAAKAAALCCYFQLKHPEIRIRGLILIAPVGLYEQIGLARLFIKDALLETMMLLYRNMFRDTTLARKAFEAGTDVLVNLITELRTSGFGAISNIANQVRRMSGAQSCYQDVRCPIVILLGASDRLSSAVKLFGPHRILDCLSDRRAVLARLFPNCARAELLVVQKLGLHGFVHFRARQISRVSLYLFRRFERRRDGLQKSA
jgi:pimeloyl-ACP methyl ester carboxylesterase